MTEPKLITKQAGLAGRFDITRVLSDADTTRMSDVLASQG